MKKESILIKPCAINIVVGKPIQTTGVDEKVLMNEVRKAIEGGLK